MRERRPPRGGGGRGPLVCSRCSWDGIQDRGCMLGIRRRGHYKELWGPASYVSILASASSPPPPSPLFLSHSAFFYLSLPTASPPSSLRNCGSLYTRSVAVLNVLSLLMSSPARSALEVEPRTFLPTAFFFVARYWVICHAYLSFKILL